MPLKRVALLTMFLLIPSFVHFVMCPVADSFTASKCQQLLIGQQPFQNSHLQQKESAPAPLGDPSFYPCKLQLRYKTIMHSLQPSVDMERANKLTILKTNRINV